MKLLAESADDGVVGNLAGLNRYINRLSQLKTN
jgi:hypothetical protein